MSFRERRTQAFRSRGASEGFEDGTRRLLGRRNRLPSLPWRREKDKKRKSTSAWEMYRRRWRWQRGEARIERELDEHGAGAAASGKYPSCVLVVGETGGLPVWD